MIKPYVRKTAFRCFKLTVDNPSVELTLEADEAYLHVRSNCRLRLVRERERVMQAMMDKAAIAGIDEYSTIADAFIEPKTGPYDLQAVPGFDGSLADTTLAKPVFHGLQPNTTLTGIRDKMSVSIEEIYAGDTALVYLEEIHYVPADAVGI